MVFKEVRLACVTVEGERGCAMMVGFCVEA